MSMIFDFVFYLVTPYIHGCLQIEQGEHLLPMDFALI